MTTSPSERPTLQIGRCVEAVEGLVQGRLYEVVRWKKHPLFPTINLAVVREHPSGTYPMGPDHGYSPKRFVRATA